MKVNFKIDAVTAWLTNNCNSYIAQYLKNTGNQTIKFGLIIEHLEKLYLR